MTKHDKDVPNAAAPLAEDMESGQRNNSGINPGAQLTATRAWYELIEPVTRLRHVLVKARFPLQLPEAERAKSEAREITDQLTNYVLPRLQAPKGPLIIVLGGPTGSGKSTLVNSLAGATVSPSGVLRPTTREPVLVCSQQDAVTLTDFPHAPLVVSDRIPPGLAFLDAPDIDSIVEENHSTAARLFDVADLWIFVTTANRYADAVPWELLFEAEARGVSLAVVLDRIPLGVSERVIPHLRKMLAAHDLGEVALFPIGQIPLNGGLLPRSAIEPLRNWCVELAKSRPQRNNIVQNTLHGVLASLWPRTLAVAERLDEQSVALRKLLTVLDSSYTRAFDRIQAGVDGGELLRGEVLSHWQDFLAAGDLIRALDSRATGRRGRGTLFLGRAIGRAERLRNALGAGIVQLVVTAATQAAEEATAAWQTDPAGDHLLKQTTTDLSRISASQIANVEAIVAAWQSEVLNTVRTVSGGSPGDSALGRYRVGATVAVVMVAAFAAGKLAEYETHPVNESDETTPLSARVLAAVFGDSEIRRLAADARASLFKRLGNLLAQEKSQFTNLLTELSLDLDTGLADRLRAIATMVETARSELVKQDTSPAKTTEQINSALPERR